MTVIQEIELLSLMSPYVMASLCNSKSANSSDWAIRSSRSMSPCVTASLPENWLHVIVDIGVAMCDKKSAGGRLGCCC